MNVLITSVGRRVALANAFRAAARARGGDVYAVDLDPTAPGLYTVRAAALVPRVTSPEYVPRLLELVDRWAIRVVVPTIDPELAPLSRHRAEFARRGCVVVVGDEPFVALGADKTQTAAAFAAAGLPTPPTLAYDPHQPMEPWPPPIIVKPRFGSNSQGVARCDTWDEVAVFARRIDQPIVQPLLTGPEITADVLCDRAGELISVALRQRLKTRGGEVERAVTIKDPAIFQHLRRLVDYLRPAWVFNAQYFATPDGPQFTEINPRFGGGYPLAHAAGVNFPGKILALAAGESVPAEIGVYEANLHMSRYDDAVFRRADQLIGE